MTAIEARRIARYASIFQTSNAALMLCKSTGATHDEAKRYLELLEPQGESVTFMRLYDDFVD